MLLRLVRNAEWRRVLDFASPSFFEVMPSRALFRQGRELVGNARDREGFEAALAEAAALLKKSGIPVRVAARPDPTSESAALSEAQRRETGQRVLEIYFAQLFGAETTLLDLRAERFAGGADPLGWSPGPYWVRWAPEFLDPVRRLYRGFYAGDDAAFEEALASLDLSAARDVFREHFGPGDQRRVRFRHDVFHSTFHEVFVRCRDAGATLHPNFVALGVYLACLYDHLALLDLEFDVRAAFERAVG